MFANDMDKDLLMSFEKKLPIKIPNQKRNIGKKFLKNNSLLNLVKQEKEIKINNR